MITDKQTISIHGEHQGKPFVITLLKGHVDVETFNAAFKKEFPNHSPWTQEDISYEWWTELDIGSWQCSNKADPHATAVSIVEWPFHQPAFGAQYLH